MSSGSSNTCASKNSWVPARTQSGRKSGALCHLRAQCLQKEVAIEGIESHFSTDFVSLVFQKTLISCVLQTDAYTLDAPDCAKHLNLFTFNRTLPMQDRDSKLGHGFRSAANVAHHPPPRAPRHLPPVRWLNGLIYASKLPAGPISMAHETHFV